jgi:hypothetical protein
MVSVGGHEEEQVGILVVRSAQQVSPPVHGTVGQVAPPSPGPPLLDPLLLPELLPLPEPLPLLLPLLLPLPLPLELDAPELLPEEELEVLASSPEAPPGLLLLPEHPAHNTAQAATAALIELDVVRENMVPFGTTGGCRFLPPLLSCSCTRTRAGRRTCSSCRGSTWCTWRTSRK